MVDRINIFSQVDTDKPADLSRFAPKPRAAAGRPSLSDLQAQPDSSKFVSREPSGAGAARAVPLPHRAELQFNTRASQQTIERFEAPRERLNVSKAEAMERAIAALERELGKGRGDDPPRPPPQTDLFISGLSHVQLRSHAEAIAVDNRAGSRGDLF